MRLHCFQHVAFESLGAIDSWARNKGVAVSTTRFFPWDLLPSLKDFDWLVIMGGPMGVHDLLHHPWLKEEQEFIRQAIDAGKTVLGICLGAQLVARVLGARVFANEHKEIGWFRVSLTPQALKDPLTSGLAHTFTPLHWHGDTFEIPPGATRLASSRACANQAFSWGGRVLGLQFHLEATVSGAADMIRNCGQELVPGAAWIQPVERILEQPERFRQANAILYTLLNNLLVDRYYSRAERTVRANLSMV